jgi:hypothetical protein
MYTYTRTSTDQREEHVTANVNGAKLGISTKTGSTLYVMSTPDELVPRSALLVM